MTGGNRTLFHLRPPKHHKSPPQRVLLEIKMFIRINKYTKHENQRTVRCACTEIPVG